MRTNLFLLLFTAGLSVVSCSGDDSRNAEKDLLSDTTGKVNVQISREMLDEMIQTLPQPIEIAGIISKSNMPFSKEMLVPSEKASGYGDMYHQSMAFGAYGVDLGYINLNEKTIYTLEYLESIKTLSEDIKVDQFFDFSTLAEMAKNRNNADSLVELSTRNFNKIDGFLREQDRGELSVLILVGAWLEGMHMFGEINRNAPSQDIQTRIGEQKVIFDNVHAILEKLATIDHFKQMKADFAGLKSAYDSVSISYEYRQPETKEVNGELIVIDKSETKVSITPATAALIISQVENIRKKYILTSQK